jgi:hypothetical protein
MAGTVGKYWLCTHGMAGTLVFKASKSTFCGKVSLVHIRPADNLANILAYHFVKLG